MVNHSKVILSYNINTQPNKLLLYFVPRTFPAENALRNRQHFPFDECLFWQSKINDYRYLILPLHDMYSTPISLCNYAKLLLTILTVCTRINSKYVTHWLTMGSRQWIGFTSHWGLLIVIHMKFFTKYREEFFTLRKENIFRK